MQEIVDLQWIVESDSGRYCFDAAQYSDFLAIAQCREGAPLALAVAGSGNYGSANQMAEIRRRTAQR